MVDAAKAAKDPNLVAVRQDALDAMKAVLREGKDPTFIDFCAAYTPFPKPGLQYETTVTSSAVAFPETINPYAN